MMGLHAIHGKAHHLLTTMTVRRTHRPKRHRTGATTRTNAEGVVFRNAKEDLQGSKVTSSQCLFGCLANSATSKGVTTKHRQSMLEGAPSNGYAASQ